MASNTAILSSNCQEAYTGKEKKKYVHGYYPSIAANSSGDLVCVYNKYHYTVLSSNVIYYAVGNMTGGTGLQWNSQQAISKGSYPRVAINEDKTVVLVFTISGKMIYRIGTMTKSCNSISWNNEYDIEEGELPSIAMSGNTVLLVFQNGKKCHCKFGELDNDTYTISWKSVDDLQVDAKFPSVCVKDKLVTVFYRKPAAKIWPSGSSHKLCTVVGVITSDGSSVEWGNCQEVPNFRGNYPCIAMFEDGKVIAAFQNVKNLILLHGTLEAGSKTVEWQECEHSLQGHYPSVAAVKSCADKGQIFVEMHCSSTVGVHESKCYYYVSRITS